MEESNKRININLQFFAEGGDKTEKATPKKRQDARKKGQVLQSREITSAFVLLLIFLGLRIFGGYIYGEIVEFTKRMFTEYPKIEDLFSFNMLSKLFTDTVTVILKTVAPILTIAVVTGLIMGYSQVGFLFTLETIAFKFSKLNPINGIKRIFSVRGIVELVKSILKIVIIGYVAYSYLKGEATNVVRIMDMDAISIAVYMGSISIDVAIRICIVLVLLGIFDYGYQWWQYEKDLKMSKHEFKEEHKQIEGNPEIK